MADVELSIGEALARIRAGDEEAAAELIRRYEPLIRREVRLHLQDRRLTRLFDPMDVCQSVMAGFFLRAAGEEYEPEQLLRLLAAMARDKVASAARKRSAGWELLRRFGDALSEEERAIVHLESKRW